MRNVQLADAGSDASLKRPSEMKILPPPSGLTWQLVLKTRAGEDVTVLHNNLAQLTAFSSYLLTAKD